jgi:hypothetical protein
MKKLSQKSVIVIARDERLKQSVANYETTSLITLVYMRKDAF